MGTSSYVYGCFQRKIGRAAFLSSSWIALKDCNDNNLNHNRNSKRPFHKFKDEIFKVLIETSDIINIFLQGLDCKDLLMGKLKRKLNFHANV